jgi:AcrR family transcriptional regulator
MYVLLVSTALDRIHQAALRLFAERGVTQITVSDLAEAAGIARGTIYNNLETVDSLFEDVATQLTAEMGLRVGATLTQTSDPACRMADGMRLFVRRAHEDPLWGRFLVRFAATTPTLWTLFESGAADDIRCGVEMGLFKLRGDQLASAITMMSTTVLGAMSLVLEGHQTWRNAGSDAAELVLRAFGIAVEDARAIATSELLSLSIATCELLPPSIATSGLLPPSIATSELLPPSIATN